MGELHRRGLPVVWFTDDDSDVDGVLRLPLSDPGPPMDVADDLFALIGEAPMVRLDRTAREVDCHLLAKLELFNPGFSSKDRPALAMVESAERDGRLRPGGTIVEPTSGNTGVGLAIVAARRGYSCIFVCPDKVAPDKIAQLRAYGAEVIVCPTAVDPEHPDSYYSVSDRLAREVPGAWKPDQYHNPDNPRAQYETTGPEIWNQTAGRITHFVCGVGTGGTITGIGRYLKERNPAVRVIGADPEGSVYSGGTGRPYLVEGVGEDIWPGAYDPSVPDEVLERLAVYANGDARIALNTLELAVSLAARSAGGPFTLALAPGDAATAGDPWFVRAAGYPGLGSSLAWDAPVTIAPGQQVTRRVRALVADGRLTDAEVAAALA